MDEFAKILAKRVQSAGFQAETEKPKTIKNAELTMRVGDVLGEGVPLSFAQCTSCKEFGEVVQYLPFTSAEHCSKCGHMSHDTMTMMKIADRDNPKLLSMINEIRVYGGNHNCPSDSCDGDGVGPAMTQLDSRYQCDKCGFAIDIHKRDGMGSAEEHWYIVEESWSTIILDQLWASIKPDTPSEAPGSFRFEDQFEWELYPTALTSVRTGLPEGADRYFWDPASKQVGAMEGCVGGTGDLTTILGFDGAFPAKDLKGKVGPMKTRGALCTKLDQLSHDDMKTVCDSLDLTYNRYRRQEAYSQILSLVQTEKQMDSLLDERGVTFWVPPECECGERGFSRADVAGHTDDYFDNCKGCNANIILIHPDDYPELFPKCRCHPDSHFEDASVGDVYQIMCTTCGDIHSYSQTDTLLFPDQHIQVAGPTDKIKAAVKEGRAAYDAWCGRQRPENKTETKDNFTDIKEAYPYINPANIQTTASTSNTVTFQGEPVIWDDQTKEEKK